MTTESHYETDELRQALIALVIDRSIARQRVGEIEDAIQHTREQIEVRDPEFLAQFDQRHDDPKHQITLARLASIIRRIRAVVRRP